MAAKVTKPIPDDVLHTFPDDGLIHLMNTYRAVAGKSSDELEIAFIEARIEDIYRVMGYRCALEYLNKHGSQPA